MSPQELRTLFERYLSAFNQFERLPIPTVAAVQGLCFGCGLELAVRADGIFAGASARFGHPEQSIGIVTVLGGIYRIAERAGRSRAIEWALTSEQVPATVMERYGVVNRVVEDKALIEEATAFAKLLAKGPTRAHAAHKTCSVQRFQCRNALTRLPTRGGLA
jgi:enoyl-CoA hydratase/carnithine racemase